MKNRLREMMWKLDRLWDSTPALLRIPVVPLLVCAGAIGFILFCLVAPVVIVFVAVTSIPYFVASLTKRADKLPTWYVRYVDFWWSGNKRRAAEG